MAISTSSVVRYILIAFIAAFLASCSSSDSWKKVDVSGISAPVRVQRFEQDFYALDSNNLKAGEQALVAKYGSFVPYYLTDIMNWGRPKNRIDTVGHDPNIDVVDFLGNASDRGLYDTVQNHYKDLSDIQKGMSGMAQHFKYYFPKKRTVTTLYTFISEFAHGAATYGDTTMCIGLDMYLGEKYVYYGSFDFPEFMRRKLRRDYIVPNATEALYSEHFDKTAYNAELPLIEAIINEGKKYYFMECMLPETPDSLLIGYTSAQEEWCRRSEGSIWKYFNEQDLLYKVNFMEQKRYTSDGPTTAGMPPESPGRVGSWVGWQIVRKFMKNNRDKVSLDDLMNKYSAKQILSLANYKPK